jgi:hypothetical protein
MLAEAHCAYGCLPCNPELSRSLNSVTSYTTRVVTSHLRTVYMDHRPSNPACSRGSVCVRRRALHAEPSRSSDVLRPSCPGRSVCDVGAACDSAVAAVGCPLTQTCRRGIAISHLRMHQPRETFTSSRDAWQTRPESLVKNLVTTRVLPPWKVPSVPTVHTGGENQRGLVDTPGLGMGNTDRARIGLL